MAVADIHYKVRYRWWFMPLFFAFLVMEHYGLREQTAQKMAKLLSSKGVYFEQVKSVNKLT